MSKNVAVFVDVANIFYAAKAAGVDIDYVTLLKSATAGRDFVRAYAYTGLDPENENQRQFHSFLSRSGYKVVSKDIRKYGDGRVKANLDIELVVDMMRMARNLDIAVVVSGDGDFAPAIRAVQQLGVRVEVISFRGNTSSDLIDVADNFTDIAQIARVDKSSARSGRRVAAEGDLSMTEVPEKETEGVPRRRRGKAAERPAVAVAEAPGMAPNLVVLPGEHLSRVGADESDDAELAEVPAAVETPYSAAPGEDGHRRRRRRGGRGRGRGRQQELDAMPAGVAGAEPAEGGDEAFEDIDELLPSQPPHHTFGSVWDSQIGQPSAPTGVSAQQGVEDEDFEEPEIPEYLLAERQQRGGGQRGQRGGRGRQSAYQAALERERFGRSSGGFAGARPAERQRSDRGRGGRAGGGRQRDMRPARQEYGAPAQPSGDPWTEVPPELEEMLRLELARKQAQRPPAAESSAASEAAEQAAAPAASRATRAPRRRATAASAKEGPATSDAAAAESKPTRRRSSRTAAAAAEGAEKPKRATRSRAKATVEAADGEAPGEAKSARRSRARAGTGAE